ncbi:MAG: hypothetical protein ACQEW0_16575 [Pseudomonadota bacterium]
MAGLDTRGLASGFSQGFGLMNQFQQQQNQNERADQQMEMQEERFDMQKEQHQGQQQEAQRAKEMEQLQFALGKVSSGMDLDDSELDLLKNNPKYWPALDPETDASIEQAQQVIDPNTSVDANNPESLAALNQMFGAEINKGEGGQKRVVGMYPGTDGESVMLELEVLGEDGSRYNAPMTKGRSNREDDDMVMPVPVERLVEQTQGMRMLRNTMQSPEAQQQASKVLGLLRGDSNDSWELEEHPRLGAIQRNTKTGEIKPVRPGAGSPYDRSGRSGSGRPPSRIQEAEELVTRGVYDSFGDAYEAVRARAGQDQQGDVKYIDFLESQLDSVDEQLDSYQTSDDERESLRARREELAQELENASRQAFDRPEQQEPEPEPEPNPSQQGQGEPVQIESDSDYEQLPSGATFVGPDGVTRRKP